MCLTCSPSSLLSSSVSIVNSICFAAVVVVFAVVVVVVDYAGDGDGEEATTEEDFSFRDLVFFYTKKNSADFSLFVS